MHKALLGVAVLLVGCQSLATGTIPLTPTERTQAQAIAEERQQLTFQLQAAQAKYQAEVNKINDGVAQLNIRAAKLCFEFKKTHKLAPDSQYGLDEWNGVLVKR